MTIAGEKVGDHCEEIEVNIVRKKEVTIVRKKGGEYCGEKEVTNVRKKGGDHCGEKGR